MDDNSKDALGKPASGWKTAVTKIVNGIGMVSAVSSVALGAYAMIRGRNVFGAHLGEVLSKTAGENASKVFRLFGAAVATSGVVGALVSKAGWDSASSASRTRNYLKLQQQLDAKEAGASRGA